jgi:heptosyltransferase-2
MTNSWRTGILARMSGARERIGYAREGRGWLLTTRLQPPMSRRLRVPTPALDYFLQLAYALGCRPESPQMELAVSSADVCLAQQAFSRLGVDGRRVVAFNTGGAFGPAKMWPIEYFARLAQRIVAEQDASVLVVCGPSERQHAQEIVRLAAHSRVVGLADETPSIGLTKACIARSRLLVTTDSGPRHFAAALSVPVITLFGPTDIAWSETHYPRATHLQLQLDCQPCQKRVCPLKHHRCMRDLSVDAVYRAVVAELCREEHAHAA